MRLEEMTLDYSKSLKKSVDKDRIRQNNELEELINSDSTNSAEKNPDP